MNCAYSQCGIFLSYQRIPNNGTYRCENCDSYYYCSLKCRELDWQNSHNINCNGKFELVPVFTLSQLNEEMQLIGQGSFGMVYLKQLNGQSFAIKKLSKRAASKELNIHKQLRNKHIIQFYQYLETFDSIYLILEYAALGHLTLDKDLNPPSIILQLCYALKYLHNNGIIHRDIKPRNVLLDNENNVKLCDFGLATHHKIISNFSGTYEFMAPEILKNYPQSFPVDIWSLGCLLYWLLEKKPIITGEESEMIEQIISFTEPKFTIDNIIAQDLIRKMLNPNPEKRITLNEIINHTYLQTIEIQESKLYDTRNSFSEETQPSYRPQIIIQHKNENTNNNLIKSIAKFFSCMARDKK